MVASWWSCSGAMVAAWWRHSDVMVVLVYALKPASCYCHFSRTVSLRTKSPVLVHKLIPAGFGWLIS